MRCIMCGHIDDILYWMPCELDEEGEVIDEPSPFTDPVFRCGKCNAEAETIEEIAEF